MNRLPDGPWHIESLWKAHQTISRCARRAGPNIGILQGSVDQPSARCRWAVFASSFNPPTRAHDAIIQRALESFGLGACLVLLDIQHADKPSQEALLEDRALMMKIAFSRDPRITCGVSSHGRFLDKLHALDRLNRSGGMWTFLVGLDNLARIFDPRFYTDPPRDLTSLFERARFVVFSRPGVHPEIHSGLKTWIQRGASITHLALSPDTRGISSSLVRAYRACGRRVSRYVHPGVETFIEGTGLYLPSPPNPPLYEARRRVLERLFAEGPGAFHGRDLRQEALAICQVRL